MNKSGITRRIDELGRIVIPKEIRKNLKIDSCDELEINIINGNLVLSKSDTFETDKVTKMLLNAIYKVTKKNIVLTTKDKIVDKKLSLKNFECNSLSKYVIETINSRKNVSNTLDNVNLFGKDDELSYIIEPLNVNGDLLGSLILFSDENIDNNDMGVMTFCKRFLENYLE